MHEFALAEAVITTALREAEREGIEKIRRIEVHVGELQNIHAETFEFVEYVDRPSYVLLAVRVGSTRLIDNTLLS